MNVALRRLASDGSPPDRNRPGDDPSGRDPSGRKPAEPVRREIATLLAVMLRLIDQHASLVVYFTAVAHGEGTSTIARELALTAARSAWCKVALIDAAGASTTTPGATSALSGLLEAEAEAAELPFCRSWFGGTELIEGVLSSAGAPLPSVEAVRALFERLRSRFTLVVVDGPPVSAARHAAAFAAAADCVVLGGEAERTRAGDLIRARATLEQLGATVLGIVLNKRRSWVPRRLSRLIWGDAP